MTEERFTEFVNLYLDKEISADDLELLKKELASNPERRQAFIERHRLHQAMRLVLDPNCSERSASSRVRRTRHVSTRTVQVERQVRDNKVVPFSRWALASGVAASLLLAFIMLPGVFRDNSALLQVPALAGLTEGESIVEQLEDPLDEIDNSEIRRFASVREQRATKEHTSLIAHMRLMGLRPELTPKEKELQEISAAAAQRPERSISQAELFQRIQALKAIPDPELLEIEETPIVLPPWSAGFGTSLVSFEN